MSRCDKRHVQQISRSAHADFLFDVTARLDMALISFALKLICCFPSISSTLIWWQHQADARIFE
jgi:hypothetical protein